MSRSSRNRLVISMSPQRLTALRLSGGLHPHIMEKHDRALEVDDDRQWQPGIAAMDSLLAEPAWHGCDITALLSSHYVNYAVIPMTQGLTSDEQNALTKLLFGIAFGELGRDWELRVSPSTDGTPTLASGVPVALLDALRKVCADRGWLTSIQPGLMPVFNRACTNIAKQSGSLALVETGRITLATFDDGLWHSIVSRASGIDQTGDDNNLAQLLAEESELHGRNPGGMLWLCDLTGTAHLPPGSAWHAQRLDPPALEGLPSSLSSPRNSRRANTRLANISLANWGIG